MDPQGVISRWYNTIASHVYSVQSPNALWHIDGTHHLIRLVQRYSNITNLIRAHSVCTSLQPCMWLYWLQWRLVIHAGIDGYSQLPVYCCCSTNNRAQTVLFWTARKREMWPGYWKLWCRVAIICLVILYVDHTVEVLFRVEVSTTRGGGMTSL